MKKIIISLGFAAATILAAQAQEVPTTPEESQQFPQEQTLPEDQQVEPQDETQPEQYPQDETSPEQLPEDQTEPQEEIEVAPAPEEEPALEEGTDIQEDQGVIEDEQLPSQETPVEESPEMEEELPAQETPAVEEDPASESDQAIEGEGIQQVSDAELPTEVTDALAESDFSGATVVEAYVMEGAALEQALGNESLEIYAGDQSPEKLYQLRVTTEEDKTAIVYITEEGEVYASEKIEE